MTNKDPGRWPALYAYKAKVDYAAARCRQIADGEKLMGYTKSCREYKELADEIQATYLWLTHVMP
jgi:hypothetical protein